MSMPWSIVKGGGTCDDDEWAVINDESGATEGCHDTEEDAEQQREALYANEPEASRMWVIEQVDGRWEVRTNIPNEGEGDTLVLVEQQSLGLFDTYEAALGALADELAVDEDDTDDEDAAGNGLLPEWWSSNGGAIAYAAETGDGRDFSQVVWSARDPNVSTLPLMLQTKTEMGHFGAELAGYIVEVGNLGAGTNPTARGRFYDSDTGRAARDLLLDGRKFGVSVDPGAVDAEMTCVEEDEDGWCMEIRVDFLAYEIIGLTMTPFPGFAEASIGLEGEPADAAESDLATDADAMAAGAVMVDTPRPLAIPLRPPAAWFHMPEPALGARGMIDVYGMPVEELLIEQPGGGFAVPLTILDDGRVFGHIAGRGSCHTGFLDTCVTPPESATSYAHFHVGEVVCEGGERVPTGAFVAGCDHASTALRAPEARDHYAHNGIGWADARVVEGEWGPWSCGALRPDVTPQQVRVLRASAASGDWRRLGGSLELISVLAVNAPGFPIARQAVVASGYPEAALPRVRTRVTKDQSGVLALTASNVVARCRECQRRAVDEAVRESGDPQRAKLATLHVALDPLAHDLLDGIGDTLAGIARTLDVLDRRTRHLRHDQIAAVAARLRRNGEGV